MRGLTPLELHQLLEIDCLPKSSVVFIEFENGDPCEDILLDLVTQGRIYRWEDDEWIHYELTDQGESIVKLWREFRDRIIQ